MPQVADRPSTMPSASTDSAEWMRAFAAHYERMRLRYPDDELCVVFDIDGTILDPRHLVVEVLLAYDRAHHTEYFHGLRADDVTVHDGDIGALVADLVPPDLRHEVLAWYERRRRAPDTVTSAYRPYRGVLAVIRWLTLLPRTRVALNTGRPERLRDATLASLNAVGRPYRVTFAPELLCMNPQDWERGVGDAKIEGLRRLRAAGLRVVAVVDNEPDEIEAMAAADDTGEILFLHADPMLRSTSGPPPRTVRGRRYDLVGLIPEREIARRVEFVWHGVNDPANLDEFLRSEVGWAEVDVRTDPLDRLVLRHDSFDANPWNRDERPFLLPDCLGAVRAAGRSAKLDFKESGEVVERALAVVDGLGFEGTKLWFNSTVDCLGKDGFRRLRERYPQATMSCPVDFLAPLVLAAPEVARSTVAELADWGVDRLSLAWPTDRFHDVLERLQSWGYAINVYALPDLAAFLEAALLSPRSLTADFNFPEWQYHGHGSGERAGPGHNVLPR